MNIYLLDDSAGTGSVQASLSITVTSNSSSSDPYEEDKPSYCRSTDNVGPNYWLEDFDSNVLDLEFFSYETGNGFLVVVNGFQVGAIMRNNIIQVVKMDIQKNVMHQLIRLKILLLKMDI